MSQKERSLLWKQVLSARPDPRDIRNTMHLSVFSQGGMSSPAEGMHMIESQMEDITILEIKGKAPHLQAVALPLRSNEILWLCIQLHGKTVFPNGVSSYADKVLSFITNPSSYSLTLAEDRQWVLFFGLSGTSRLQLLAELPSLRQAYEKQQKNILQAVSISYLERQIIEGLCKKALGPFNALYQTGVAIGKLFDNYTFQLTKARALSTEELLIQTYHRALAYVQEHYLSEGLTRDKIAEELGVSPRNLTRAFEGRDKGLKATILIARLYKGRELLQTQHALSIEEISRMLHFWDSKHFAVQYKKCFHRSPREDRKEGMPLIKKLIDKKR
ncbi:MAG: AraC family transcriptional regulator [Sphingobacterium sp.]|nr:AraC family transcriptional regulator [Sphingobacterium sp.]